MYDVVIKNGTVVTASNSQQLDVAVDGEQIVALGHHLNGRTTLDATGKLVIPGGVDIHVHVQMPLPGGVTSTDTFLSGTRAAAFGGTTTIVDFVAAEPGETLVEAAVKRRAEADPQVIGDYALHMTIGPDDIAKLNQLPEVAAAGISTYKLYMAYGFRLTDDQLYHAFRAIREVGGQPVIHAENWDIICALVAENLAAGRISPHWHPRSRPAPLEGEAAGRAIDIANYVGLPLHIFHVSCADVVARIRAARAAGWPITGETCPQYLFLTQDAYDTPGVDGALPVCAPPLRPQADQDALWAALADNDLQLVTTDHCPFTREEKARGLGDFSQIPGGVPSIEMRLASLYQGVRRGLFSASRWVELCCTAPARLARLEGKGDIAPGFDADLVIFDPDRPVTLGPAWLHEAAGWTPYDGQKLTGWPETVLRRGQIIITSGSCLAAPGSGRYLFRQ